MGDVIGYYFEHWDSNFISISVLITLLFVVSGYFYGKVFQKFCKSLKDIDATFLGIFAILGLFQIEMFWLVNVSGSTQIAFYTVPVLLIAGPVLCLVTLSNPLPTWKNLFGLLTGIAFTGVLIYGSSLLTTNSTFFDTVTYMSQVIESSKAETFGRIVYVSGIHTVALEPYHDYQGYYYLFAMLLRWVEQLFGIHTSLSPVYIWSGTMLYGMCLGLLTVSSVNVLYPKHKWLGLLLSAAILAPYYTNYFNTTLAFFGHTMRQVVSGASILIAYQIIKTREKSLWIPLFISYMAGMSASSSSFFIDAFITASLFFFLAYDNEHDWKTWVGFVFTCIPIFIYMVIILLPSEGRFFMMAALVGAVTLGLMFIAWLLRNHMKYFCLFGKIVFPLFFAVLVFFSVRYGKSDFGYDFYFVLRSENDMTVNYTNYIDKYELWRNIILYVLLALALVNIKTETKFKIFLMIAFILFLNPLVQPAVNHFFTYHVYTRAFDILVNPFTITFLIWNVGELLPVKPVNIALRWLVLPLAGALSVYLAYRNITIPVSKTLTIMDEDYNWENKVSDDSYDMYNYIETNISDRNNPPAILSQDINLKGYVPGVITTFSSSQFRNALANPPDYEGHYDLVTLLYPDLRYMNQNFFDEEVDYSKLKDVVQNYPSDYILMVNTLAVWNDRGWYEKCYAEIVALKMVEKVYENKTWILFRVNPDWEPEPEVPAEEPADGEEPAEVGYNDMDEFRVIFPMYA